MADIVRLSIICMGMHYIWYVHILAVGFTGYAKLYTI